jgi:hypothetical protein
MYRTVKVAKVTDHLVVDHLPARVAPQLVPLEGLGTARSKKQAQKTYMTNSWCKLLWRWLHAWPIFASV